VKFPTRGGPPGSTFRNYAGTIFAERARLGRGRVAGGEKLGIKQNVSAVARCAAAVDMRNIDLTFTHQNVTFPG